MITAGSDGFAIFNLQDLVSPAFESGLLPVDTSLVSVNDILPQQTLIDFFNANNLFEGNDIVFSNSLLPYKINNTSVLVGSVDGTGLVIYADPQP